MKIYIDLSAEKQVIIDVLEAIIELYPEIKEGMNDDFYKKVIWYK